MRLLRLPMLHDAAVPRAARRPGAGRGFTLIEVLAVAAIMTILATVSLAYLQEARIQAREVNAVGALNQLQNAYESYWVTNGRSYPHYLSSGSTDGYLFKYPNPDRLLQDLVAQGLLPQRYSGIAYDTPDLLAPGYRLEIFPFDRADVNTTTEDPSNTYALALQPFDGSKQRYTLAIINGSGDAEEYHARFYKLPDRSLNLARASVYAMADGG